MIKILKTENTIDKSKYENIDMLMPHLFLNHVQQQLAGIFALTVPQIVHLMSVSWQLSTQKGIQHNIPVKKKRQKHQPQVTPPLVFYVIFPVSFRQMGQIGLTA